VEGQGRCGERKRAKAAAAAAVVAAGEAERVVAAERAADEVTRVAAAVALQQRHESAASVKRLAKTALRLEKAAEHEAEAARAVARTPEETQAMLARRKAKARLTRRKAKSGASSTQQAPAAGVDDNVEVRSEASAPAPRVVMDLAKASTEGRADAGVVSDVATVLAGAASPGPREERPDKRPARALEHRHPPQTTRVVALMDSGAGANFVPEEVMLKLGFPRNEVIDVEDVNGAVTRATGSGPVFAKAWDKNGVRVRINIGSVYAAPSFSVTLISLGALQGLGIGTHLGDDPALVLADGRRLPIAKKDNVWHGVLDLEHRATTRLLNSGHDPPATPRATTAKYGLGMSFGEPATGTGAAAATRPAKGTVVAPAADPAAGAVTATTAVEPAADPAARPTGAAPATGKTKTLNPVSRPARQCPVGWGAALPATTPRLEQQYSNWAYYHAALGHSDQAVRGMVASGLLKGVVAERPGQTCLACETARAKRTAFGRSGREEKLDKSTLRPYMRSTIDLYGPLDHVGDRNGHRYLWGAACQATGANFLQPLQAKSQ